MINYTVGFLSEEHRVASQKAGGEAKLVRASCRGSAANEACAILELDRARRDAMMSGDAPEGDLGEDRRPHRPRGEGRRCGPRGAGLGFRRRRRCPWAWKTRRSCRRSPQALLDRGYSERDIQKILGGNILRVMEEVERARGQ